MTKPAIALLIAAFLVFAFYFSTAVASLQKCQSFSWKGPVLVSGWDNHYWCVGGEAKRWRGNIRK